MPTSQAVKMNDAVQQEQPVVKTRCLTVLADMPTELRVMSMLEQIMRETPMREDECGRIALWFFDKYGA